MCSVPQGPPSPLLWTAFTWAPLQGGSQRPQGNTGQQTRRAASAPPGLMGWCGNPARDVRPGESSPDLLIYNQHLHAHTHTSTHMHACTRAHAFTHARTSTHASPHLRWLICFLYTLIYLMQGLANSFYKGPDSKYFHRPHSLYHNYSPLQQECKHSHRRCAFLPQIPPSLECFKQ